MRVAVRSDGGKYYEYVLTYVDDLLCSSERPDMILNAVRKDFQLKEGSVGEPSLFLGADIIKWRIDGTEDPEKIRWGMSSELYCKKAVREVKNELKTIGLKLQSNVKTPLSSGYRPELDATPELDFKRQNYYQGLIGVLRWMCELGRLDILMPVSLMSRYLAQARTGHLEQLFHIFAYLNEHERSTLVFDDTEPTFPDSIFNNGDWSEFYPDAKEEIPRNCPTAYGKGVSMSCFCDSDHAGCKVTRQSHTGVLIFVNRAPIIWYSKRQTSVESSTFPSEFIAMKTAIELIEALRYKLRMMGVKIYGACSVFCDNGSVVKNASIPESTLNKKSCSIAYHMAREAQAQDIIRVAKEDGETNISDMFTKLLAGPRLKALAERVLW